MSDKLIQELEQLHFNKIEARVYIELLKYKELNGSQIAKKINASRSSVYSALNHLYQRGIVFLIPGDTQMYRAENPETLIEKLKAQFEEAANTLKDELLQLEEGEDDKNYYNLAGTQNFINKAKELLLGAEQEVYINTCLDLHIFRSELEQLGRRGVRIIVFTYDRMEAGGLPVELYRHPIEDYDESQYRKDEIRLMLVVDLKTTLICSAPDEQTEMTGTFTENELLAHIVSEHIHHDIYLLKLKDKHHTELIDETIALNTLLERKLSGKVPLTYKQASNLPNGGAGND